MPCFFINIVCFFNLFCLIRVKTFLTSSTSSHIFLSVAGPSTSQPVTSLSWHKEAKQASINACVTHALLSHVSLMHLFSHGRIIVQIFAGCTCPSQTKRQTSGRFIWLTIIKCIFRTNLKNGTVHFRLNAWRQLKHLLLAVNYSWLILK